MLLMGISDSVMQIFIKIVLLFFPFDANIFNPNLRNVKKSIKVVKQSVYRRR